MLLSKLDENIVIELIGKPIINFEFTFDGENLKTVKKYYKLTELECFYPEEDSNMCDSELEHFLTAENTCVPLGCFYPINKESFTKNCIIIHRKSNGMPLASLDGWCSDKEQLDKIKSEFEILAKKETNNAINEIKAALEIK